MQRCSDKLSKTDPGVERESRHFVYHPAASQKRSLFDLVVGFDVRNSRMLPDPAMLVSIRFPEPDCCQSLSLSLSLALSLSLSLSLSLALSLTLLVVFLSSYKPRCKCWASETMKALLRTPHSIDSTFASLPK